MPCPWCRLDDAVLAEGLSRVDLLKVDVEGAELALLRGAKEVLRRHRPLLLLEVNEGSLSRQGSSSAEVLALLDEAGYTVQVFAASGDVVPLGEAPLSDNVVAVPGEMSLDQRIAA